MFLTRTEFSNSSIADSVLIELRSVDQPEKICLAVFGSFLTTLDVFFAAGFRFLGLRVLPAYVVAALAPPPN